MIVKVIMKIVKMMCTEMGTATVIELRGNGNVDVVVEMVADDDG